MLNTDIHKSVIAVVFTVLLLTAVVTATGGVTAQSDDSVVDVTVSSAPDTAAPGSNISVTYTVNNTGDAISSYTIDVAERSSNVTVTGVSGDIQAKKIDAEPPSASTDAIDPGMTATVTVTYALADSATGAETIGVEAREPLSGDTDTANSTTTIETPEPEPATELTVTAAPDLVTQGNGILIDYEASSANSSLTLDLSTPQTGLAVETFTGAIRSQNVTAPPTATTEFINTSQSKTVAVEYRATDALFGPNDERINQTIELRATNPLENETDTAAVSVTIQKPEATPDDPEERARDIAAVNNTSELSQNDVTAAITRFDRRQGVNGIDIKQNDITTLITLFERQ